MKIKAKIRRPKLKEVADYYGVRLEHHMAELDGVPLAMGTITRAHGKAWGWFDVKEGLTSRQRLAVFYALKNGLRKLKEPAVYVTCNAGVHERAMKLLRAVGFVPTGETVNGQDIWVWQNG